MFTDIRYFCRSHGTLLVLWHGYPGKATINQDIKNIIRLDAIAWVRYTQ